MCSRDSNTSKCVFCAPQPPNHRSDGWNTIFWRWNSCTAIHRFIHCVTLLARLLAWILIITWFVSWIGRLSVAQTLRKGLIRFADGPRSLFAGKFTFCVAPAWNTYLTSLLFFISRGEWNMVLIVVLGSKRHDLHVHSAILLEVSRSCRFCNINPKQTRPLPTAVSPKPSPKTHARVLPKLRCQNDTEHELFALTNPFFFSHLPHGMVYPE